MDILISPVSSLPDEVLCKIFIEICWAYRASTNCETVSMTRNRRSQKYKDKGCLVALVCRRWRSVALGWAEMWSFISIPDYSLEQVRQYLIRSKRHELTVLFAFRTGSSFTEEEIEEYNVGVIKTLNPHMNRITSLSLRDLSSVLLLGYMATFLHAAIRLESLRLSVDVATQKKSTSACLRDIVVLHRSSRLSELVLQGVRPVLDLLRADTISHLTLENVSLNINYLQALLIKVSRSLQTLTIAKIDVESSGPQTDVAVEKVRFAQLSDLRLDLDHSSHLPIFKLFDVSAGFSIHSVLRFSTAYNNLLESSLIKHFSDLNLNHDNVNLTVNPPEDYVLICSGNFQERIELEWEPDGGSIWTLCKQTYRQIHHAVQIHSMRSFEVTFLGLGSGLYDSSPINLNMKDPLARHHTNTSLQTLLVKASCLQRIQISLGGYHGKAVEEEQFVNFENELISLLYLVQGGTIHGERGLMELHEVVLKGFIFGEHDAVLGVLDEFLSEWKFTGSVLRIEEAHFLGEDTILKLSRLAGTLYIDGALVESQ